VARTTARVSSAAVLEGFELAEPTESAVGQLTEVERGEVLGVE